MTDYGVTLGVPNTGKVEGVGERKHPGQEQPKKQKKKQKEEKKPLLTGHDEVVLSGESEPSTQVPPKSAAHNHDRDKDDRPDDKGAFIDVKI